jgi:hypothetical protein
LVEISLVPEGPTVETDGKIGTLAIEGGAADEDDSLLVCASFLRNGLRVSASGSEAMGGFID